ncbi:MAG: 1-aminocyclopropane-1-carboxylate deaminase/D-cysteine desulfhydrase [Campylobacterota bacterium]|nr:1-aminocyclopropane-1-carboxylate deaminase/D-cysteine desulfhydrase [Campylobacterota bacterium]
MPFFIYTMIKIYNSPIQKITFNNHQFLVKRDDLLHKDFSGNKARKFHYFLDNDFPQIDTVISYGSNQSNAMYSLSVLAKLKGWRFIYYTDHIPSYLEQNPQGNYKYALENDMEIRFKDEGEEIRAQSKNELYISEGGSIIEAQYGLEVLANEIREYQSLKSIRDLKVFLPSGTGTTALYLQKYLDNEVLTCPCVGDSEYLKKQFLELENDESTHPTIIKPPRKFHFGKLYKENFEIWKELKEQTNIEFDLLYDPIGWQTLLDHMQTSSLTYPIIYIHQGGLIGNETMLARYVRKYEK